MKVKLIKESSGFGFNSRVVDWMTKSSDNAGILDSLQKGLTVDLPELVAANIHNLVDVSTGEIVSKSYTLVGINTEFLKTHYIEQKEVIKTAIKQDFQKIQSPTKITKVSDED